MGRTGTTGPIQSITTASYAVKMSSNSGPEAQGSHSATLKDFLASIVAIRGDLSNITAPPFVLDSKSVVEIPAFWAERPAFFVAPASSSDPAHRALLVLRWFLVSLKNQHYGGRSEEEGVRKPLNAFLGECFLAKWHDGSGGETMLVSEQVSHHPPVTACRVWNQEHGVYAEGFTRQEITLSLGSIAIKQTGHALLTLKNHGDETYLIPLPDAKVKGILSGLSGTYPELEGTYTIPCTSGYYSTVEFSGKSLVSSGKKNEFVAKIFAPGTTEEEPLYTVAGQWSDSFTIYSGAETSKATARETLVVKELSTAPLKLLEEDVEALDPWETRRAWRGVREALARGDMAGTVQAKSAIEQGQREMRKEEERTGKKWEPLFFKPQTEDGVAAGLYRSILKDLKPEDTVAIWKFDEERWGEGVKRPFHETLTPDNQNTVSDGGIRHSHHVIIVGGHADDDGGLASPASFHTASEYPFPTITTKSPEKPAYTPAKPTRPKTPTRESVDPVSSTPATPSTASTSPSVHRGKRQRARDSIGKFRLSLTSSLSKIGSSPGRSEH